MTNVTNDALRQHHGSNFDVTLGISSQLSLRCQSLLFSGSKPPISQGHLEQSNHKDSPSIKAANVSQGRPERPGFHTPPYQRPFDVAPCRRKTRRSGSNPSEEHMKVQTPLPPAPARTFTCHLLQTARVNGESKKKDM